MGAKRRSDPGEFELQSVRPVMRAAARWPRWRKKWSRVSCSCGEPRGQPSRPGRAIPCSGWILRPPWWAGAAERAISGKVGSASGRETVTSRGKIHYADRS